MALKEWNRRYIATSHGVKTYTIVGEGMPRRLFRQTHARLGNDSAQPSTQQASSIQSIHGKYNPSRALVDGFCLFSTSIVAFRNCFLLNWSDVQHEVELYLGFKPRYLHTGVTTNRYTKTQQEHHIIAAKGTRNSTKRYSGNNQQEH